MYTTETTSEAPEHEEHDWFMEETVYDNPIEVTYWAWCTDCKVSFYESSTTIIERR